MDVAGVAGQLVVPLGHEGHGLAGEMRDLLDAVLQDDVAVGHLQRIGIAHVDLGLAGAPLALGILHRDPGALQPVADRPHHGLFLGGLEDVVILDVAAGRLQILEALFLSRGIGFVEKIELQLAGAEGPAVLGRQPLDLAFQDVARGVRNRFAVMVGHVAQHQGRALQPRQAAQGLHIRLQDEVAVALLPVGRGVTGHRLHIDVVGQQIVAGMGFLIAMLHEKGGMEALADQPAELIRHRHHHGVDLAGIHGCL